MPAYAGMTSFPRQRESRTMRRRNYAHASFNLCPLWSFRRNSLHDIFGARVTTAGQVLDEFPIFTAPGGQVLPSVAFDGVNYLVIWSDTRSGSPVGPDADIFGARVTPAGSVLDSEGIPISTAQ